MYSYIIRCIVKLFETNKITTIHNLFDFLGGDCPFKRDEGPHLLTLRAMTRREDR